MKNALWILSSSPQMMRCICTLEKIDTFLVDLEHSSYSFSDLSSFIEIIRSHRKLSCLRLSNLQRASILHGAELNPDMIMIPAISTKEDVDQVIEYFYVPPVGTRGFSPYSYAALQKGNDQMQVKTKLCLQLESRSALENINIFDRYPYVNSVFVGRYDLAKSYGIDIQSSTCFDLLIEAALKLRSFGLKVGTVCLTQSEYTQLEPYYDFLSLGSDITRMLESKREF